MSLRGRLRNLERALAPPPCPGPRLRLFEVPAEELPTPAALGPRPPCPACGRQHRRGIDTIEVVRPARKETSES